MPFVSIYKQPMQKNQYFVSTLKDLVNFFSNKYENKVVLGDFNLKPSSPSVLSFMDSQNVVSLIKNKTCFKNFVSLIKNKTYFKGKDSCIDLILTNRTSKISNNLIYKSYKNFPQKDF